jgi:predicted porin
MKKSLFALAALGAFAGAAQAQSSVTLYGNMDLTEAYQSGGGAKSVALTHAGNSTSLWGFRGTEDMGGGLKTGFDLKSEINLTTGQTGSTTSGMAPTAVSATTAGGTANLFTRGANVFISSASLGEVKIGRQDDLEWAMSGRFSTSGSNSFGSNQGHAQMGNLASTGLGSCITTTTTTGLCSVAGFATGNYSYMGTADAFMTGISYKTPSFAGFTAQIQTGLGANSGIQGYNVGQQQAAGLGYTGFGGALNAELAQSRRFDDQGLLGMTLTSFGLSYKATNALTLIGLYTTTSVMNTSYQAGTAGAGTATVPTTVPNSGVHGNDMWSLGVNYQVTPAFDVNVAYTRVSDNSTNTYTSTAYGTFNSSDNVVSMYGLTGRYNLSKRTQVYGGFGVANNGGMFFMSPIYGGTSLAPTLNQTALLGGSLASTNGMGSSITGAMLGLRHQF